MADEPKGPLEASVGEQVEAKARLDASSEEARRADERARERVERRKADEQATVLEHTGGERRVRARREGGAEERGESAPSPPDLLGALRALPLKPLAVVGGVLLLLNGRRRRGRIARFLVPLGAASFVLAVRRGWMPAVAGAR